MQKIFLFIVVAVGVLSVLMLYYAGFAYQRGQLELGGAFTLLRYAAYVGITGVGLGVFFGISVRPRGPALAALVVSVLLAGAAFILPYRQQLIAAKLPAIHDISTDTVNPPEFVAVVPWRTGAANPPEYDGPEIAAQQREAYPDIASLELSSTPDQVFNTALALVQARGWAIATAEADQGRIEAVVATRWFGFRDDVVIRIRAQGSGSLFDMRSKSRIGRHDFGANAGRIRKFTQELEAALQ